VEAAIRLISVNLENVIKHINHSGLPVLVDFCAPWCGPCLSFAPIYKEFAERVGNQLCLLKVDTEANHQAGIDFNIRSIPTLAIFFEWTGSRAYVRSNATSATSAASAMGCSAIDY